VNCRQVTQLLSDVVYFVAYQENDGTDPFMVQVTHSDRERPKLLREQNVLKQVSFTLAIMACSGLYTLHSSMMCYVVLYTIKLQLLYSRNVQHTACGPQSVPPGISVWPARSPRNVKNDRFVSIRCVFSSSKIRQNSFSAGAPTRTLLGELTMLPETP